MFKREPAVFHRVNAVGTYLGIVLPSDGKKFLAEFSPEIKAIAEHRMFEGTAEERGQYGRGFQAGGSFLELETAMRRTDRWQIYATMFFFWPEIDELETVKELAALLARWFRFRRWNLGKDWQQRVKKAAEAVEWNRRNNQPISKP
jgi:hypothetical protein